MSITIYKDFNHSMAFSIGESFNPAKISRNDLVLLAHDLEFSFSFLKRQFTHMIKSLRIATEKLDLYALNLSDSEAQFINSLEEQLFNNMEFYEKIFNSP